MKQGELLKLSIAYLILYLFLILTIKFYDTVNRVNNNDNIFNISLLFLIVFLVFMFVYVLHHKTKSKRIYKKDKEDSIEMYTDFVIQIEEIVHENLSDPTFSVVEIEKKLGVSRPVLLHRFKKIKGTTLVNFIKKERLKKASELLETTSDNISEIAYKVGFSDPKYFSKSFRQSEALTPTQYRRKKQNIE